MADFKPRGVFVWTLLLALLYAANAQFSELESLLENGQDIVNHFNGNDVQDTVHTVESLGVGVIVAIVAGGILLLVSCICCCYCCCCRTRPPPQQTVIVSQNTAPSQPTVVVAQAPQAVYNQHQPMGPVPMQQPVNYGQPAGPGYDGPPPYPGQQSGYGYAKL